MPKPKNIVKDAVSETAKILVEASKDTGKLGQDMKKGRVEDNNGVVG